MPPTTTTAPACPERGHDHRTVAVWTVMRNEDYEMAYVFECPTHHHRWVQYARHLGRALQHRSRLTRPRLGWLDAIAHERNLP